VHRSVREAIIPALRGTDTTRQSSEVKVTPEASVTRKRILESTRVSGTVAETGLPAVTVTFSATPVIRKLVPRSMNLPRRFTTHESNAAREAMPSSISRVMSTTVLSVLAMAATLFPVPHVRPLMVPVQLDALRLEI